MRKKRMEADHETTSNWKLVTLYVSMWSYVWPPLKPAPLPGVGIRAQTTADQMTDYAQTRCFTFSLYSKVLLWPTFTAQLFLPEGASLCESKKKRSSAALQENKTKTFICLFTASQIFLLSFLLRRHYETLVKKRNAYNYWCIKKNKTHWIKKINPKSQRTFQLCGIQPGTITTADLNSKNKHGLRCCSLLRAPGLNLLISAGWGTSSFTSPQSRLSWFSRVILQRLQHTCGTRPFLIGQNPNSQKFKFHHFQRRRSWLCTVAHHLH